MDNIVPAKWRMHHYSTEHLCGAAFSHVFIRGIGGNQARVLIYAILWDDHLESHECPDATLPLSLLFSRVARTLNGPDIQHGLEAGGNAYYQELL